MRRRDALTLTLTGGDDGVTGCTETEACKVFHFYQSSVVLSFCKNVVVYFSITTLYREDVIGRQGGRGGARSVVVLIT